MASRFTIDHRMEKNDLYLRPRGDLDGSTAWQMINLISDLDDGRRRIVIDTCRLGRVSPFGGNVFRCQMRSRVRNLKRIHFKGGKGSQIAPPGCRVMAVCPKQGCRCSGDFENCTCHAGKEKKGRHRVKAQVAKSAKAMDFNGNPVPKGTVQGAMGMVPKSQKWVNVALTVDTLDRLLATGRVCAADFRCLDCPSKDCLWQLCLENCLHRCGIESKALAAGERCPKVEKKE